MKYADVGKVIGGSQPNTIFSERHITCTIESFSFSKT
jgi:hypothetical protein